MTRAEFDATYEILAEHGVRTYTARSRRTRSIVMVHFLDSEPSPAAQSILARLQTLSPENRSLILQSIDVDGAPVVITKYMRNLTTLAAWVATCTGEATIPDSPKVPAESAPAAGPEPATKPGEFTLLFGKQSAASPEPRPGPPQGDSPLALSGNKAATARMPEAPPSKNKPGEFTQLFGKAEQPPPPARNPGPGAVAGKDAGTGRPAAPTSKSKAGEFTQLFGHAEQPPPLEKSPSVPPPAAPLKPPPAPASAKGPGEFTRLFSPENLSAPPPSAIPRADSPKGPPGANKAPGELTRLFGEGADASRPPLAPSRPAGIAPKSAGDDFSRRLVEGSGSPPPVEPPPVERPPAPTPSNARGVARPGEFTEMFGNAEDRMDANTAPRLFGTDPAPAPSIQLPMASPPVVPPAAPPAGLPGGGAGDYLQRLRGGNPEVSPPPVVPKAPPRASPGPSAFTRALRRVSSKVQAPAPSSTIDPDSPTGTPGLGIVLGVVGAAGVIAVGLILYFVLTRT